MFPANAVLNVGVQFQMDTIYISALTTYIVLLVPPFSGNIAENHFPFPNLLSMSMKFLGEYE